MKLNAYRVLFLFIAILALKITHAALSDKNLAILDKAAVQKGFVTLPTEDGKLRKGTFEAKHMVAFGQELCTGFFFNVKRDNMGQDLAVIFSSAADAGLRSWGIRATDPEDDRDVGFTPPLTTVAKDFEDKAYQQVIVGVQSDLLVTGAKYLMYFCYDKSMVNEGDGRTIIDLKMAYKDYDFDKNGRPVLKSVVKALDLQNPIR